MLSWASGLQQVSGEGLHKVSIERIEIGQIHRLMKKLFSFLVYLLFWPFNWGLIRNKYFYFLQSVVIPCLLSISLHFINIMAGLVERVHWVQCGKCQSLLISNFIIYLQYGYWHIRESKFTDIQSMHFLKEKYWTQNFQILFTND